MRAAGPPVALGIDLGTQSVRVLAADLDGIVLGAAAEPLTSVRNHQPGHHEQDADQWWQAVCRAARSVTARIDASAIRSVATCGTSGSFVLLAGSRPATGAVMYDDARGQPFVDRVRHAGAAVWERLGYPMQSSWALPRLAAVLADAHLRGEWECGRLVLAHSGDVVTARLAGHRTASDWSQSLKTGYDTQRLRWPSEVFDALGIATAGLPEVVAPGTAIGSVCDDAAAATGLPPGTRIVAGTTDSCAAQFAAGARTPGAWNSVLGTTLALKGFADRPMAIPGSGVYSHRHPERGWLPGGASNIGARYLGETFGDRVGDAMDRRAAQCEPAPGITFPLVGVGERFPFQQGDARAFSTVRSGDDAVQYAAALQGIAFVERLCFDVLRAHGATVTGPIGITGGAARSRYWTSLRASVLGEQVYLPACAEPAFGMAVLAASTDDGLTAAAHRMVHRAETIDPDPLRGPALLERYAEFVDALVAHGAPLDLPSAAAGSA
jgi:sugar (pentulose or hexulose) kinase